MKVILAVIFAIALIFTLSITNITAEEEGFVRSRDFSLNKRGQPAKITFYEDDQLENAACYGRDGMPDYNAKPSDMIAATGKNMCYQCLQITNPRNKKK